MRTPLVLLASCQNLPEPDVDEALLVDALRARGLEARVEAWDAADVPWSEARLVILRSTWNYFERLDAFLAWARRVAAETTLLNPIELVAWNAHKRYLLELAARGLPVVPTELVPRGSPRALADIRRARGFEEVVVKPAVSAGSFSTRRFDADDADEGEAFLRALAAERDVLVQPYVRAVEGDGERSIVCIEGHPCHAIRKTARFSGDEEQVSAALPIREDERALAQAILASVAEGSPPLYARVDLARDEEGHPRLMELEVIEPSLFLRQAPATLERFVAAIAARAAR